MSEALSRRFFIMEGPQVSPVQLDDPNPLPARDFPEISQEEIAAALAKTSNKSAPGSSGINYKLLKWAFASRPDRFLEIFNSAISLSYHPWKEAVVVVIPKPNKPDYSLPKAYRPISLLECCGKLLEKIVAKRILADTHTHDILLPTQFGTRDYHSAVDAAMCLVHNAQAAVKSNLIASVILFDIQGFFDNINIERMVAILINLGFAPSLCLWVCSFLSDRQVRLSFNGFTSDPIHISHGTPQGSPLSPILSALFTSPLLKLINSTWSRRGLNMFVDDGAIFGCGPSHKISSDLVRTGFDFILEWLSRSGLRADPDKTEFITFYPKRPEYLVGPPITAIAVDDPFGRYPVKRSEMVRYLGIFIHHKFQWSHHVKIMANRARSTIRALSILGNSVRGLDYANWRRVFHALIVPVLSYGFPLFSSDPHIKGLTNTLQIAQNDAVRKMSGCFKTTPITPLHYIMAIPPFSHTLKKLTTTFTLRLQRLPPSCLLRTLPYINPSADWHLSLSPVTSLTRVSPHIFPQFTYPSHPSQSIWSHPHVWDYCTIRPTTETKKYTKTLISQPPHNFFHVFINPLTVPSPPFAAAFLVFRGERLVHSGMTKDSSRSRALLRALAAGLAYDHFSNQIRIFLPDCSLSSTFFRLSKHADLSLSHTITNIFSSFVSANELHCIDLFRHSIKWSGLPGKVAMDAFTEQEQQAIFPLPPTPLLLPKERLLRDLQAEYLATDRSSRVWQSITLPDGRPPPFYISALSRKDRGTSSSAI